MTFREKFIENEIFIKSLKAYLKMQSITAHEQTMNLIKMVDHIDENDLCEEIARLIFENRCIHTRLINKEVKSTDIYFQDTIEITSEASNLTPDPYDCRN